MRCPCARPSCLQSPRFTWRIVRGPFVTPRREHGNHYLEETHYDQVSSSRTPTGALGLKRGAVELVEHSPLWEQAFIDERNRLERALEFVPCEIEHIGSTAVPGLEAKPILDIAVGIRSSYPVQDCIPVLEEAGYIYRGDDGEVGHMFAKGPEDSRTHYVHLVRLGDSNWDRWLTFRDYLRRNEAARQTYAREKNRLAVMHRAK